MTASTAGAPRSFLASSFGPAFFFLPARRRRGLAAVYAFARTVDDAVDEVGLDGGDPAGAREQLNRWRAALKGEDVGFDKHEVPVWRSLRSAMEEFSIPARPLLDLVDGVERDLNQNRYDTFEDLAGYCHGVAGTVGLACLPVFGLNMEDHRTFAEQLGLAVQLVNILRDVKADALRDHIYLPAEDMRRFGLGDMEILGHVYNEPFFRLMECTARRARSAFDAAWAALPDSGRPAARPALVMGRLYRRLLDKLEARRYQVYTEPVRLTWVDKISCLAGTTI